MSHKVQFLWDMLPGQNLQRILAPTMLAYINTHEGSCRRDLSEGLVSASFSYMCTYVVKTPASYTCTETFSCVFVLFTVLKGIESNQLITWNNTKTQEDVFVCTRPPSATRPRYMPPCVYRTRICRCYMFPRHVPATWPLVWRCGHEGAFIHFRFKIHRFR